MKHTSKLYSAGFTLTEVLLAVMIVGLIGIALASLTRASAREGGVGRSRVMLRNNAAMFVRTLRQDIEQSSVIESVAGPLSSVSGSVMLLKLKKGLDADNNNLKIYNRTHDDIQRPYEYVVYCFEKGATSSVPSGSTIGGVIKRVASNENADLSCSSEGQVVVLDHVKFISNSSFSVGEVNMTYPVPLFTTHSGNNCAVDVNVITELDSKPVLNDLITQTFVAPAGC